MLMSWRTKGQTTSGDREAEMLGAPGPALLGMWGVGRAPAVLPELISQGSPPTPVA